MSDPLYRKAVLRLAANATGAGRLPDPHGTGTAHNPTCGDRVIVEMSPYDLEKGRIIFRHKDERASSSPRPPMRQQFRRR